ncbi:PD-(D/E)XK nuclease family protein (plasmid) [Nocardia sp. CA-151230]|uniref:PD-(D/E)XK nuclease family protein n=1 Tax=Nocardia sp. CA-151230 TaxID=3239982 RepID=UPI003D8CE392
MTDHAVKRDYFGRPFVSQDGQPLRYEEGRKTPVNAVAYTRVSTLAETLDDKSGLLDWSAANAAVGVVRDASLYAQLAHLVSAYRDPWQDPVGKKQLKPLVARAQQVAGSDDAAGMGTAFHGLTEIVDQGRRPEFAPPPLIPWLSEYQTAMADWEVLDTEVFVVNDELQTAGSLDRLLRHRKTGRVVVGDLKTGKSEPDYPLKTTVQVAIYARGERYDQESGARAPLHEEIDLDHGLLIHAPIRGGGEPKVTPYPLDLAKGWEFAQLSLQVRAARKLPKLEAFA